MTTDPADVERLIARLLNWDEWYEGKINDARYDAVAALRTMQAEKDDAWKVAHDATTRGMKAEAKLAEVEKERDNFANLYNEGLAWVTRCREEHDRANAADATVAKLTAQVEAMRGALRNIDALDPEQNIYGFSTDALRGLVLRMGEIARAALTKENHNG